MAQLADKEREPIEAAIFVGNKIEAIKLFRAVVPGAGLADAKSAVEAMETKLRAAQPEKFSTAANKPGCLGVVAALVLMFVLAGLVITWVRRS